MPHRNPRKPVTITAGGARMSDLSCWWGCGAHEHPPVTYQPCWLAWRDACRAAAAGHPRWKLDDYEMLRGTGVTREDCPARLGVTKRTIDRWETAIKLLHLEILAARAKAAAETAETAGLELAA